ncbi:hypothetical protein AL035_15690 [Salipiger aestuarii]|uniref:Uncharacterized protein n=1 Tax=Salipiger aestuarii TaxID=568098 RepID=A0A327YW70_9RHOB|nr:hypothetical protein [Salipiger aestuarii]KAB2540815.1 hypothetical protein AL035_15690 [Salipiger aestuarii]RAK24137.1 hypothetical protein ATI53_1001246 [Salipiger aestuarii]
MSEVGGKYLFGTWLSATEIGNLAVCADVSERGDPWAAEAKDAVYKLLKPTISPHISSRSRGGAGSTRSLDQAYQLLLLDLATNGMDAPEAVMRKLLTIWALETFGRSTELTGLDDGQLLNAILKELGLSS